MRESKPRRPRIRISLGNRILAWMSTLFVAPLLFAVGFGVVIAAMKAHERWPHVPTAMYMDYLANLPVLTVIAIMFGLWGAVPALTLGIPACWVLEPLRASRPVYAAVGFLLGLPGGRLISLFYFANLPPDGTMPFLAGSYGALVAVVCRTITLNMERAARQR